MKTLRPLIDAVNEASWTLTHYGSPQVRDKLQNALTNHIEELLKAAAQPGSEDINKK